MKNPRLVATVDVACLITKSVTSIGLPAFVQLYSVGFNPAIALAYAIWRVLRGHVFDICATRAGRAIELAALRFLFLATRVVAHL